jgi:outer membrane protein insertion porin family
MSRFILYILFVALIASSCNVSKRLPEGEKLYRGATIDIKREKGVKGSTGSIRKQLKNAAKPTPNKFILGQPYKVWWWYVIGEPKRETGFRTWLRKQLAEPPVLSSRINALITSQNMEASLENTGYFHSKVQGDTANKGYFTKAIYHADIFPQYTIKNITWVSDSSDLLKTLESSKKHTLLAPGDPYSLNNIQAERTRLDLRIKTKGYYFFNPDYIMAYADSTIGNHQVNLFLNVKKAMPENARHAYTIDSITLFPNYTNAPDTSKFGLTKYDGLLIRDTVHKFKPELFKLMVTYRPGAIYSSKDQNTSLNRLINLGTFGFVKNRFEVVKDSPGRYLLNSYYYLTPSKNKSLQGEIDGFSKDNGYVGSQLSINWKNRNAFKGAEQLAFKIYGSFEVAFADSVKNSDNFRVGAQASITFPTFEVPFFSIKESNLYPPRTNFSAGYELYIKQAFYTQNISHLQYEFDWKESSNKEYTFAPIAITYLNATNITDSFYNVAKLDPAILFDVYSEVILGSLFSYKLTTINPSDPNQWYFTTGLDVSGNVAGLITNAKDVRQKTVFNTPFAQYVKTDAELTYKRIMGDKLSWVNHLNIGIGMPYNNSSTLPFSKQYIIGGASSVRGFPIHSLGPGSYLPNATAINFLQIIGGDYKLLFNSELRFPLFAGFTGAVFADIGNIWTKDTTLFGPAGQLHKDFYKELAVSSGFGIRFDAGVLLLRLDLGIPLRKPYLPDGQRWVFNKIALGDGDWRTNNLIVNLAIGYPF